MGEEDHTMSDFEVALMDTIKVIFEVLIAKQVIKAEVLDKMLQAQRRTYEAPSEMSGALFVVDELRRVLQDPVRAQVRSLLEKPSEGSA